MSRSPSHFQQAVLTRAVRALKAAGYDPGEVRFDSHGGFIIVPAKQQDTTARGEEELDRELAEFEVRNGDGEA